MSATTNTDRAPVESGLQDIRLEWVAESTPGEFVTDPEWNKFSASDHLVDVTFSPSTNREVRSSLGFIDGQAHDRAAESATATVSYLMSRFPVDASGNVQDPIAYPITAQPGSDYPSHTVVARREVTGGGNDDAGFREFAVMTGARPVSSTFDGAADTPTPLPQELGYEAERVRVHVVHQPSSAENIAVVSDSEDDTNDVTIESADAGTTETVTLPGSSPNAVETTSTFEDIDAIEVEGEHEGDISVGISDGSSPPSITTDLLENSLDGTESDGVDSIDGIPALGSGSHASVINDPGPLFIGTSVTIQLAGAALADRLNTLSASVERDVSREPKQGTRRESIDVGARSTSVDVDVGGPFATHQFEDLGWSKLDIPIQWEFDTDETLTFNGCLPTDIPDYTRSAGDTNYLPSVTFEPTGDPAVEIQKA